MLKVLYQQKYVELRKLPVTFAESLFRCIQYGDFGKQVKNEYISETEVKLSYLSLHTPTGNWTRYSIKPFTVYLVLSGPCLIRNPDYNGYYISSHQLNILIFNLSNPDSCLNRPENLVPEGSGLDRLNCTSDECHAWFHLNVASPAERNTQQVNITKKSCQW